VVQVKTPLVLIHAFPLHAGMYEAQANDFPGRRLLTPDLPGIRKEPRLPGGLTMEAAARHVAAKLDAAGLKGPVAVGGVSMGGYAALEFARLFPERLAALILACTRAGSDSPQAMEGRYQTAAKVKAEGVKVLADSMPQKLIGKTSQAKNPGLVGRAKDLILENGPEGLADALAAMARRRDSTPILPNIKCPTLVLTGEEDILIPPDESRSMAKAIPGAKLVVLPACGHLPNLEHPDAFRDAVASVLP
jgi:pimeloyl-ACP methyl ester carboxylesterase